jgi:hypothetical protein
MIWDTLWYPIVIRITKKTEQNRNNIYLLKQQKFLEMHYFDREI